MQRDGNIKFRVELTSVLEKIESAQESLNAAKKRRGYAEKVGEDDNDRFGDPSAAIDLFKLIMNAIERYAGEIAGSVDRPRLSNLVGATGSGKHHSPQHLLMAVLSDKLFEWFEFYTFSSGGDECTHLRNTVRAESYGAYEALVGNRTDPMRRDGKYAQWHNSVSTRIKDVLPDANIDTSAFRDITRHVFALHYLCFSLYPRFDLIIRRPGSLNVFGCTSSEGVVHDGTKIAFMILPGMQFEKVVFDAFVAVQ